MYILLLKEGIMKKIVFVFLGIMLIMSSVSGLDVGDDTVSFANMNLEGKFLLSKNYVGKSWIIIDFFATYCVPCKEEIPELEILLEEFGEDNLQCFVMATDKDGSSIVGPYFQETPTSLTVLIDRYMVTAKRFDVDSIPTVFLISPEGKIEFKAVGYSKEAIEEMRAILTNALSE